MNLKNGNLCVNYSSKQVHIISLLRKIVSRIQEYFCMVADYMLVAAEVQREEYLLLCEINIHLSLADQFGLVLLLNRLFHSLGIS